MAFVDGYGIQATAVRIDTHREETRVRAKSMAMLQLQRLGWSLREIAKYFGTNHEAVRRRIRAIPPDAAKYYTRTEADAACDE